MAVHPKVQALERQLRPSLDKPKSTPYLFFRWVDLAKAFHVHPSTVRRWHMQGLPCLPLTRLTVERWLRDRNLLTHKRDYARMARILEWRIYRRATNYTICSKLRISYDMLKHL